MIRPSSTHLLVAAAALLLVGVQRADIPEDTLPEVLPDEIPLGLPPELGEGRANDAVVALGRKLFFDTILSADRTIACASCHDPAHGFADPRPKSIGIGGQETLRHAPTLFNRALGETFLWDGRAATLEKQVLLPIADEREMGLPVEEAVTRLSAEYPAGFDAAFGGPPTADRLADALAAFVRRILRGDSPLDRFRAGEIDALSAQERGGMWFFESRGGCWRCHVGANLSDEEFHNTGIGVVDGVPEEGRSAITGEAADRGRFKTPTLRGVAETAPYMHDGSFATLEDVIEFYREGGHANDNLDDALHALEMSAEEAANLAAFLRTL